jgi:phosphate-selective porin OprO and OprP
MKSTRSVLTLFLSLILVGASSAFAGEQQTPQGDQGTPPAQTDDDKDDVQKRLQELEEKLRILERQREVEQEAGAAKAKDTGLVSAGKDGIVIKSADGANQLKLRALVNVDGRFWDGQETRPATDTFELRRARPILEGTVSKLFDFRLAADFGEGKTTLFDAYIDWRFASWIKLRAGKFKAPVGLERLQAASDTAFVERALPTNLVPNRDVGLQLGGDILEGVVSWAAGVFNGVPDGANVDLDTNDNKETEARVFLQPFKRTSVPSLQNLGFGVAATNGNNIGTLSATGLPSYKTPGQQTFFSYRTNTPATLAGTTVAGGRRHRLSPQAYWYVWRFGALAERVESYQEAEIGTSREEIKNTAWQATVSFALTDDRPTYRGIAPKRSFDPKGHGWGALELVVRAAGLKIDDKAFPTFADPTKSASEARERGVGLNWYLSRNVKWMLDYIRTRFRDGDVAGDREDEKVVLNRLQISY